MPEIQEPVPPHTILSTTVDRDALLSALDSVKRITERRCSIPILSNVLLQSNGALTVTATDQEITQAATVDCRSEIDGAEVVGAMLVEFEEWAQELRRRIQNSKREASKS